MRIRLVRRIDRGDHCNVSRLFMGSHTGTHMDAPFHFIRKGRGLDEMPIDATVGDARVIHIYDPISIKPGELARHKIRKGERILFKTRNSSRCWKTARFLKDFVYVTREAARELARIGVRCVGVDYLSVGGYFQDGVQIHRTLLERGIWIIEGLDLSKAKEGRYHMICLPIKVLKSDGAPARAVLKPLP